MKFEIRHQVVVAGGVDDVFDVLARPDHLERVIRLSPMATRFELLGSEPGPTPSTEVATFEFGERVRMLGGLYRAEFTMRGTQTIDAASRQVDYRTRSAGRTGIRVHKVRTFTACEEGTRVAEVVVGHAAPGLHWLARRSALAAHRDHMGRYPSLFRPADEGTGR